MVYKPQLTSPKYDNPYYNTISNKGYSKCICGNTTKKCYNKRLNTLPNCVGYAWGRFNEIIGDGFKYYCKGNAEDLYDTAKTLGLKIGTTPKVGAIICWKLGKVGKSDDGCGHVAVVEQILDKNTIVINQSGWSSTKITWTAKHTNTKGNWLEGDDYSWMKKNKYIFQGFIYNPAVSEKDAWGACPYAEPTKVIKKGSKGTNVKWLQWNLNRLGYNVDIDGSFGPKTEATLKIIQKKFNVTVDAMCGPVTRSKIKNA